MLRTVSSFTLGPWQDMRSSSRTHSGSLVNACIQVALWREKQAGGKDAVLALGMLVRSFYLGIWNSIGNAVASAWARTPKLRVELMYGASIFTHFFKSIVQVREVLRSQSLILSRNQHFHRPSHFAPLACPAPLPTFSQVPQSAHPNHLSQALQSFT